MINSNYSRSAASLLPESEVTAPPMVDEGEDDSGAVGTAAPPEALAGTVVVCALQQFRFYVNYVRLFPWTVSNGCTMFALGLDAFSLIAMLDTLSISPMLEHRDVEGVKRRTCFIVASSMGKVN